MMVRVVEVVSASRFICERYGDHRDIHGRAHTFTKRRSSELVEAALLADVRHRLWCRRLPQVGLGKIARQRLDAEENDHRHGPQENEAQAQTLDDQRGQRHVMTEAAPASKGS